MTERVELYRLSFLDLALIVATKGLWVLYIYWWKRVTVPASTIEDAA